MAKILLWRNFFISMVAVLLVAVLTWVFYPKILTSLVSKEKGFNSAKDGFSIEYPASWSRSNSSDLAKSQDGFSFAVTKKEPFAFFGVRVKQMMTENNNFDEISKMLDQTMPKQFKKFEKVAAKTITLNSGEKTLKYDFMFVSTEGKLIREQIFIILTSKKVYYIAAWTEKKNIEKVKNDFERIVQSLRVSK